MKLTGTCSWFGGPLDTGVSASEGLAFIFEIDDAPGLFLPEQPLDPETGERTTGLARRLDPSKSYIACRWDYELTSKEELLELYVIVRAPKTGKRAIAKPADWGPHEEKTGRVADLSPGLMEYLGIETDDEVEVFIPVDIEDRAMTTIVISSGHGLKVRGASGEIDEVDEARRVVPVAAERLRRNGCEVIEFHDDTSTTQNENLETIVAEHNSHARDLDVSVHFNAYDGADKPMGTEVLYVSQSDLAAQLSNAIARAGELIDRGPKYRNNLYFLNNTTAPAVLLEICFCDSSVDAELYEKNFQAICDAIADTIQPPPAVVSARRK